MRRSSSSRWPHVATFVVTASLWASFVVTASLWFTSGAFAATIYCPPPDRICYGTSGDDVIYGTGATAGDTIYAGGGHDTIIGYDGHDYIEGQTGDDTIIAGPGRDRVFGGSGSDSVDGGHNRDDIRGGWGVDIFRGKNGNDDLRGDQNTDLLYGGRHSDLLVGGTGGDRLDGFSGVDTLIGTGYDDYIVGGEGYDFLLGDLDPGPAGDDRLFAAPDNAPDEVYGYGGYDRCWVSDFDLAEGEVFCDVVIRVNPGTPAAFSATASDSSYGVTFSHYTEEGYPVYTADADSADVGYAEEYGPEGPTDESALPVPVEETYPPSSHYYSDGTEPPPSGCQPDPVHPSGPPICGSRVEGAP